MNTKIKINIIRPCLVNGLRVEVGRIEVSPLVANDLIAAGKGELVRDEDAKAVREAVESDVKKALKLASQPWAGPAASPPWTRIQ